MVSGSGSEVLGFFWSSGDYHQRPWEEDSNLGHHNYLGKDFGSDKHCLVILLSHGIFFSLLFVAIL